MLSKAKSNLSGKKIFLTGLIVIWSVCVALSAAGLRFGMTGAIKEKVKELDVKVAESKGVTAVSTSSVSTSPLLWSYITEPIYYGSASIGGDGTIYIGSQPSEWRYAYDVGAFYALTKEGNLKWRYELGLQRSVLGAAAIGSSALYFVSGTNDPNNDGRFLGLRLHALADQGSSYSASWTYELYTASNNWYNTWQSNEPAIASDGTVYASGRNNLYAILPNGTTKWILYFNPNPDGHQPGYVSSPVIGSDGTIYVNVEDSVLVSTNGGHAGIYAIDPSTGGPKWRYVHDDFSKDNELASGAPSIASDGTIYAARGSQMVGTTNSYIYAVNSDGSFKWRFYTQGRFISATPSIGADGTLYVGTTAKNHVPAPAGDTDPYSAGMFFAINPNGTEKWRYDTSLDMAGDRDIYSSAVVGNDGIIYFTTEARYVYAFNSDGTINTKYDIFELVPVSYGSASIVHSCLVMDAAGILYMGNYYHRYVSNADPSQVIHQGAVYALRSKSTGPGTSAWPQFRKDAKRQGRY